MMVKLNGSRARWFYIECMIVVILLSGLAYYYARQKNYFHVDDSYSYHFVCRVDYPSLNQDRPDCPFYDTWHDASYFGDYFIIDETEKFDVLGVLSSIKKDSHPPLYYILLELFLSLFSVNRFSKWTGLALNFLFYFSHLCVLFAFSKRILKSRQWALLTCFLYGSSVIAMSTFLFIRMYLLFTALCTTLMYEHLLLYEYIERGQRTKKNLCLIVATSVAGMLTHYYFLMFFIVTASVFAAYLLLEKKFANLKYYMVAISISLLFSAFLWPETFNDLLHGYRGKEAIHNFMHVGYLIRIKSYSSWLFTKLLGEGLVNFVLVGVIVFIAIITFFRNRKGRKSIKKDGVRKMMFMFCVIVLINLVLVSKTVPSNLVTVRYIYNLFPIISVLFIYLIKTMLGNRCPRYIRIVVWCLIVANAMASHYTGKVEYQYKSIDVYCDNQYPTILITKDTKRTFVAESSFYLKDARNVFVTTCERMNQSLPYAVEELPSEYYIVAVQNDVIQDSFFSQIDVVFDTCKKEYLGKSKSTHIYLMSAKDRKNTETL